MRQLGAHLRFTCRGKGIWLRGSWGYGLPQSVLTGSKRLRRQCFSWILLFYVHSVLVEAGDETGRPLCREHHESRGFSFVSRAHSCRQPTTGDVWPHPWRISWMRGYRGDDRAERVDGCLDEQLIGKIYDASMGTVYQSYVFANDLVPIYNTLMDLRGRDP